MNPIKTNYSVPQGILYTACLAAWNLCSQNLQKFTDFKAFYTAAFIADAVQAVELAKKLPQSRQTVEARKTARINLSVATRQVLINWQALKAYITKAFDAEIAKAKLEAAGASLYNKASVDNWSAVRDLIDATNVFIAGNLADLLADQNMPATFQATFQADGDTCIDLSLIFAQLNMDKQEATSAKIDANNAIYASVIEMLKDGQIIFKDDVVAKKKFAFSYLVSLYQGNGSASLKGYVFDSFNLPIEGATILSQDEKYMAITDAKGYYRITRIAEGTYTFSATCPGYNPSEQVINFVASTASKADFQLASEMKKVA